MKRLMLRERELRRFEEQKKSFVVKKEDVSSKNNNLHFSFVSGLLSASII